MIPQNCPSKPCIKHYGAAQLIGKMVFRYIQSVFRTTEKFTKIVIAHIGIGGSTDTDTDTDIKLKYRPIPIPIFISVVH